MKKILLSFFIGVMLIGINNGDGFVDAILFQARQSTKWRCGRQILLIR